MNSEAVALEKALKELRRNLEKRLVRQIGNNCAQTSNSKKAIVKALGESKLQNLKSSSVSYISSFKTSAKGQWVNQATKVFQNTSDKIS